MLFKIAWRNIWRNRTRSLVVIASVAVGLFAAVFMDAFFYGMGEQDINTTVETQLSHIQFHNPQFPEDKEAEYTIPNGDAIIARLKKDTLVKGVSGRLVTTGMISSTSSASGVEIHGVVPGDEKQVSVISTEVVEGAYFDTLKRAEVVIGQKLAEKLGIKLHNKIVLTFQSKTGDLTAGSFRIAGLFKSRNSAFDQTTVFTRFGDLDALLGTGGQMHEIAVILKDGQQAASFAQKLKKESPGLLVQDWKELSPEMAQLMSIIDQSMYIIIGIILLALMFGIINTMLMAVLERQREFGMLMAIGMNKPRVFFMVVLESVLLTCAGIPAGILFTVVTVGWLGHHGINLSSFSAALSQYGFSNVVYPVLHFAMFVPITIMTALTAILSAIYPAIKALRFKPAEAIHKI